MTSLAAAGCASRPVLPLAMTPIHTVPLAAPLSAETLAVLDFADRRPDFEQTSSQFDEHSIGSRWLARDRFWSFHATAGGLAADPAAAPDLRARVTGTAAFAWYSFPNHGWGRPEIEPVAEGLADYLALELEQRGIFAKVIRTRDLAEAEAAGATLVLDGRIDRFGAMLAEAHDPFVVRPDDWNEFHLVATADFDVALKRLDGDDPLLERECVGHDDDLALFDELTPYRGSQARPLYPIDATDFSDFALHDMAAQALRALERATTPLLAEVELTLTPYGPAAPPAPPPAEGGRPSAREGDS